MKDIPEGFELVSDIPEGYEVVSPQEQPAQESGIAQNLGRPIARAVRSGLAGIASVGDIAGAAVEPIRQGMRSGLEAAGVDFMGQNTPYTPPSQAVKNLFDELTGGIAKPRSPDEEIVDVAGEAVSGGGVMKGAQKVSSLLTKSGEQLLKRLAPQTGTELLSIAGAGAGSEIARQIDPENPIAPVVGAVVGGYSTLKGINAIRQSGDIQLLDKAYFNRQAQRLPDANKGYFNKQAVNILAKNLEASPEKLSSLKLQLKENKDFVLPDVGGDEVRALTRQVGKFKGGARNDVDKFFTSRDTAAGQRIINVINNKVSGVDKYYGSLDELASVRSELAKNQYTAAYDNNKRMKMTPSLNKFVQDGRFQAALSDARKEGLINIEEPTNSLRTLDAVYRRLRDKAGDFAAKNQKDAATVYGDFARDFVKRLDAEVPLYKKARNTFAGFSNLIEAQELGSTYINKRPEEIRRILKGMTKGERDAYKIGVRESLEKRILTSGKNADEAAKIFGKPENRKQLKVILGDEYLEFSKKMRSEMRMADTKFRIIGGSRTDYNAIEDGQFIESTANLVKGGKVAFINEAVNAAADAIKRKYLGINKANSKILAKALTSNKGGLEILDRLISQTKSNSEKALIQQFKQDYEFLLVPTATVNKETN